MSFQFLDKLSTDYTELLNDKEEYNVIIDVDKESNKKSFTAHSVVLRHRSSYFRKELTKAAADKNRIKTIVKPNISSQVFVKILRYAYGGAIDLGNVENGFVFDLMISADEFEFEELSKKLEIYLIEKQAAWLRAHFFSRVFNPINSKNNRFKNLEKFCNNIIVKYPGLVFDTEYFNSFEETALISILKRDDIQMDEAKIWDKVIQWGIAKIPTLPLRIEEWSDEDFAKLKITLQQCLPHIRYFQLRGEDVFNKLEPYKKILEEKLWNDLMKKLIMPDWSVNSTILPARSKRAFSNIINDEHAAEISSWIDNKLEAYSSLDIPYEFRLILRGSRDGFSPETFWNMCHGHIRTAIVLKVEGTNEILGGYNPLAWNKKTKESCIETTESFIFSLKNEISNISVRRVEDNKHAIFHGSYRKHEISYSREYGPRFGRSGNLWILIDRRRKCYSKWVGCYEGPNRINDGYFYISDYEVFDVVMKTT